MFCNLLIMTAIVVFIIDLSGVVEELEKMLAKWLKVRSVRIPKPFSCSLCMSWWLNLIYIIVFQRFTLFWIGICALLAFLTPVIMNALIIVRDILQKVLDLIVRLLRL